MPVAAFVGAWTTGGAKSFRADPPNAGLTTFVDGKFKLATVELSTPRLDGTTVTYAVRILSGTVPPAGGETSLFIDGGCNWGDTSGC
jgi:hypothetical protein